MNSYPFCCKQPQLSLGPFSQTLDPEPNLRCPILNPKSCMCRPGEALLRVPRPLQLKPTVRGLGCAVSPSRAVHRCAVAAPAAAAHRYRSWCAPFKYHGRCVTLTCSAPTSGSCCAALAALRCSVVAPTFFCAAPSRPTRAGAAQSMPAASSRRTKCLLPVLREPAGVLKVQDANFWWNLRIITTNVYHIRMLTAGLFGSSTEMIYKSVRSKFLGLLLK